jgi:hypothetical protein
MIVNTLAGCHSGWLSLWLFLRSDTGIHDDVDSAAVRDIDGIPPYRVVNRFIVFSKRKKRGRLRVVGGEGYQPVKHTVPAATFCSEAIQKIAIKI